MIVSVSPAVILKGSNESISVAIATLSVFSSPFLSLSPALSFELEHPARSSTPRKKVKTKVILFMIPPKIFYLQ